MSPVNKKSRFYEVAKLCFANYDFYSPHVRYAYVAKQVRTVWAIVSIGSCAVGICGTELSSFVRISPNKNLLPGCEQFRDVATGHGFGVRSKNPPFCTESPK